MVPLLCFGLAAAPEYGQHEGDNGDESHCDSDYYILVFLLFSLMGLMISISILIVDVEAVLTMIHLFAKVMMIFAIIRGYLQRS